MQTTRIQLNRPGVEKPTFTGERFVPGLAGARIAYEHLHRYAFARRFVAGRRVLDLGCGLGYGVEVLAPPAIRVVGLDCDRATVHMARNLRTSPAARFVTADAARLPFADHSFDAVVCFELIEHVTAQEALIAEVRRVLAPDGLLVISSPDTAVYSGVLGEQNPFHMKELTTEQLMALLTPHFDRLALYRQRVITGSLLCAANSGTPRAEEEVLVARFESAPAALTFEPRDASFVYNIVVCGPAAAACPLPASSILADVDETLTTELEHSVEEQNRVIEGLKRSVAEWEAYTAQVIHDKDKHLAGVIEAKDMHLAKVVHSKDDLIRGLEAGVQEWQAYAEEVVRSKDERIGTLEASGSEWERRAVELEETRHSLQAGVTYYEREPLVQAYVSLKRFLRRLLRRA